MNSSQQRLERLTGFLNLDPDNARLLCECAELGRMLKDKRAKTWADRALSLTPDAGNALYICGLFALDDENFSLAEKHFEKALILNDLGENVRYGLALAQFFSHKPALALTTLKPLVIRGDALSSEMLLLLARTHFMLNDTQEAEHNLKILLDQEPKHVDAHGLLALLYSDLDRFDEAQSHAEAALSIDPEQRDAGLAYANIALNQQQIERATSLFDALVKRYPKSARAWLGAGLCALAKNDAVEGEKCLQHCLPQLEKHTGLWSALGWSQLAQNKMGNAEISFQNAITHNPDDANAYGGLASVYLLSDRSEKADEILARGKNLDNTASMLRVSDIIFAIQAGNENETKSLLDNLFDSQIDNVRMSEILARITKPKGDTH